MNIKERNLCKLCKSVNVDIFHKGVRDNEKIDVYRCSDCGTLQLFSINHIQNEFYENELMRNEQYNCITDEIKNESWSEWIQETAVDDERRIGQLKELCKNKRVLDFGCGNGGFLRRINTVSKECVGIELDKTARKNLNNEGINVFSNINEVEGGWDVITMFQVIEHLVDPIQILKDIKSKLNDNGILIIETPNAEDSLISFYKNEAFEKFTFWSVHVFLYTSGGLKKLLNNAGYCVVQNDQIQRYSLANHLFWLSQDRPGGHEKWKIFNDNTLNRAYEIILKEQGICDTLFGVFKKELD